MYAVSDATAVADTLTRAFAFPSEDVNVLLDGAATKEAILTAFMSFANLPDSENDRIIVFFAGHGHTASARRGEVGFLVPHNGSLQNLASLIRWDELTRNSDLIPAKHMLFLMDACYGGLAITRSMPPGAMRFLNDMLTRYSRQVITAGKADEVVADIGGPLPGHSIFTGHLLEAFGGKATDPDGLLTANGIMAYVYRQVGHDPDSHQTPHFGHVSGDGDLIFASPNATLPTSDDRAPVDILVPAPFSPPYPGEASAMTLPGIVKRLLSEPRFRIELHDLVAEKTREVSNLGLDTKLSLDASWDLQEFQRRLALYEESTDELLQVQALIARWGTAEHLDIISLPSRRLASPLSISSGLQVWIALRWYPIHLLAYASGLSSVAGDNYNSLAAYMHAPVTGTISSTTPEPLLVALHDGVGHARDAFKYLPGRDRQFVPMSEYLFKFFQPKLDDLLFLGTDYEGVFDRFEILTALEYAHLESNLNPSHFWGPVGRFGWKHRRGIESSPFRSIFQEASLHKDSWPPIRAGLFDSSYERFDEIATKYGELLGKLAWY